MTVAIYSPTEITKRDGRVVPFEAGRIRAAIVACFAAIGEAVPWDYADELTQRVVSVFSARGETPTVEGVQDVVEMVLQSAGLYEAAKAYILYRHEHARVRDDRPIPDEVRAAYDADAAYFPTPLQRFQFADKYSRWNEPLGRRETWIETVDRTVAQLKRLAGDRLPSETYERIRRGILEMEALPSMRLLSMAGPAFERDNATQFNCTYLPIESLEAWPEALMLSMAGCGVGFSVEREYVHRLPMVKRQSGESVPVWTIEDSAEGWGGALRLGLEQWFGGYDVAFDYSEIRPYGAVLRTKGGRASGPEPLKRMLDFVRARILARQGASLRPIDAHDIMCMVGTAAVSGGVRRTAMISLFDADDAEMLACKDGDFEALNPQRWNANNSAVWTGVEQMDQATFVQRFMAMVTSGRGEPGIFSRDAADALMPERRSRDHIMGCNPCAEILLRPYGMCNLTTVVARSDDTYETLAEKVELAAIIGTIQSTATHFPNLRPIWKQNGEEERLLGVSIGGQQDCPLLTGPDGAGVMRALRDRAVTQNEMTARSLGINRSAAVTCVKPDGNSSQLTDASSGLHARWAPYYIRNVRVSASSPLAHVLKDAGVPMSPENGDDPIDPRTWVVSFPVKAPEGSVTRNDRTAIEQCMFWLRNKIHWTEHNPSVTITYEPDEVIRLMGWVWDHREVIGGMAFLPSSDAAYAQLPYIEIDRAEYERRMADFPEIDWPRIWRYEAQDRTTAAQEVACASGLCEV